MVTQSKLEAVRAALEGTTVVFDKFLMRVAEFFGYTDPAKIQDEDLACLRYEDLEKCGLPPGKARRVANILREPEIVIPQKVVLDLSNDPEKLAATLSPVGCVLHYNPADPTSPFARRIAAATGKRKCLVFDAEGRFCADISEQLVQEIIDGYPERDSVTVGDVVGLPTYAVGERPDRFVAENPARPGTPISPMDSIGWHVIPTDVQQLLYIAVKETGEACDATGRASVEFDLHEKVLDKTFVQVAKRFPKAAKLFQQRKAANTLPQLRIRIGSNGGNKPNDPFHVRS